MGWVGIKWGNALLQGPAHGQRSVNGSVDDTVMEVVVIITSNWNTGWEVPSYPVDLKVSL